MRDVDAEQLRRAVRDLADPPDGAGWNTADLADALDGGPLRPAAVLVPFVRRGDDLSVLFTRRADHLRNHAGQVSFPGGRIEAFEQSFDARLELELGKRRRIAGENRGNQRHRYDRHDASHRCHQVGAELRHRGLHHLPHVLGRRGAGLGDGVGYGTIDDRRIGGRRQVRFQDGDLRRFLGDEVLPTALLELPD